MQKMSPFFTATAASLVYFFTFLIIKYLLEDRHVDWNSALQGAVVFWFVIFIIHQFLNRRQVQY